MLLNKSIVQSLCKYSTASQVALVGFRCRKQICLLLFVLLELQPRYYRFTGNSCILDASAPLLDTGLSEIFQRESRDLAKTFADLLEIVCLDSLSLPIALRTIAIWTVDYCVVGVDNAKLTCFIFATNQLAEKRQRNV